MKASEKRLWCEDSKVSYGGRRGEEEEDLRYYFEDEDVWEKRWCTHCSEPFQTRKDSSIATCIGCRDAGESLG